MHRSQPDRPNVHGRALGLLLCLGLGLGLAVTGFGAAWTLAHYGDDLIFLGGGPARWIVAPLEPMVRPQEATALVTSFERTFVVEEDSNQARRPMRLRALGRATVSINDRVVATPDDFHLSWKRVATIDTTESVHTGNNTIRVDVVRAGGPAALNLSLGDSLKTDTRWQVSLAGSSPRPARYANTHPAIDPDLPGTEGMNPFTALRGSLPEVLGFGLLAALVVVLARSCPTGWRPQLPRLAGGIAVLVWIVLYVHNAGRLPLTTGFDALGHLDYIRYILDNHAIPPADGGWQMYQPPLFYLLCAGLIETFADATSDASILRGVTFGAGIAQVLLLGAIARELWPNRALAWVLAMGFGAFLPMHLYLFHFVSNETLAMALNTATSLLVLRLLTRVSPPSTLACAGVGACLGLAMLAKFSALVLLPVILLALAYQFHRIGARRVDAGRRLAALVGTFLVVCGWHFGSVWVEFGNPLVGNWDPSLGFAWWQAPGYRTVADYLTFGRSLSAPWYGGFAGVVDGVYSTLWGDALASGATATLHGAPWNHRLLAAGYALSLLPSLVIVIGCAVGSSRLLRGRLDPSRHAAVVYLVGLAAAVVTALVYMTLKVPSYAQSKAFYIQPAIPVLCVAFVYGTERLLAYSPRFRPVLFVSLGTCAAFFFAAVWIQPLAPSTKVQSGYLSLFARDPGTAEAHFRIALASDPTYASAHAGLAAIHAGNKNWPEAMAAARNARETTTPESFPKLTARVLNVTARGELAAGRPDAAEHALRKAITLDPTDRQAYRPLVNLLLEQRRLAEASDVLRDQLWIAPLDENIHRQLKDIERRRGS